MVFNVKIIILIFLLKISCNQVTELKMENIEDYAKTQNYTLVFYYLKTCKACKKFTKIYNKLAIENESIVNVNIKYIKSKFDTNKIDYVLQYKFDYFPLIVFYIKGYYIKYQGKLTIKHILNWVTNILNATTKNKLNRIKYYTNTFNLKIFGDNYNKENIKLLSQIYYDNKIFSGSDNFFKKQFKINTPEDNVLYVQRFYDETVIKIDLNKDISEIVEEINNFEFPKILKYNDYVYEFIVLSKSPLFIFGTNVDDHDFIKVLKNNSKLFSKYLRFVVLDSKDLENNSDSKLNHIKNILNIKKIPFGMYLFGDDNYKLFKYKYKNPFEELDFKNFLYSCINKSLKPYVANQNINELNKEAGLIKYINKDIYINDTYDNNKIILILLFNDYFFDKDDLKKYEEICNKLNNKYNKNNENIQFKKLNVLLNDISLSNIETIPSLLLFSDKKYYKFEDIDYNTIDEYLSDKIAANKNSTVNETVVNSEL